MAKKSVKKEEATIGLTAALLGKYPKVLSFDSVKQAISDALEALCSRCMQGIVTPRNPANLVARARKMEARKKQLEARLSGLKARLVAYSIRHDQSVIEGAKVTKKRTVSIASLEFMEGLSKEDRARVLSFAIDPEKILQLIETGVVSDKLLGRTIRINYEYSVSLGEETKEPAKTDSQDAAAKPLVEIVASA